MCEINRQLNNFCNDSGWLTGVMSVVPFLFLFKQLHEHSILNVNQPVPRGKKQFSKIKNICSAILCFYLASLVCFCVCYRGEQCTH